VERAIVSYGFSHGFELFHFCSVAMKAALHPREIARLAALQRYEILDTPDEQDFDDIVELAARLCEAPAAQINFIDVNRQWSKAEVGVGVRTIPLEVSLCAHAILEDSFVEVEDTLADHRMHDNPVCVGGPKVRFYAGALLKTDDGYPIGTLCVLDFNPRSLTELQRHALQVLANQIVAQLNLREMLSKQALLRSEIDHRVKNSLQTISAFVHLECAATNDAGARGALGSVEQQISTVALLHDHLSKIDSVDAVEIEQFLTRVIALLDRVTPKTVKVAGQFAPLSVNAQEAALLGTIVNELVANSAKHSFRAQSGEIKVTGMAVADGTYRLTCEDNASLEDAAPTGQRVGLGLRIIGASVGQLRGKISTEARSNGYRTIIEFQPAGT
jgi:two-component sensor histidine kinase